ncbi:FAD-dependent oxidoreductase [Rhodotorula paludigena]|uniref:FAD-dependent oxidoreductase n=1 Tax=Rhodotorula paludigena TaxID=86838 RepID=UPI003171ECE9
MTTAQPLRVAVVGGGIAGLCAALALEQQRQLGAQLDIRVFEQASKFGEIGAGVSIGPNSQRALRRMGLGDELDKVAAPPGSDPDRWFEYRVGQAGENEGKTFANVRGKDAARGNVHRADFLNHLIKKLPEGIAVFNRRASSYTPTETGVQIHFENEGVPPFETDVLICSDGIKSLLRGCLYQRKGLDMDFQRARYAEWIAWRGLIPREKYNAIFGDEAPENIMHCGQGRHILTFPVRGGSLINIVAFVRDEEHAKLGNHTGPWSEPRPKEEMLEDFAGFNQQCRDLLGCIETGSIWGIFSINCLDVVTDDRVVLIGDAGHATTPHCGAGAGQAIEDALFMAAFLAHPSIQRSTGAARTAAINRMLAVYERERHPRAAKVQRWSHEGGMLYEYLGPEGSDLAKMKGALESRMKWIWEFDGERELERLLKLLDEEM